MLLLEAKLSLKSSRQVTRSMEGQDRMQRSDSRSLGPGGTEAGGVKQALEGVGRSQTVQCLTCRRHDGVDGEAPAPAVDRAVAGELPLEFVPGDPQFAGPVGPLAA